MARQRWISALVGLLTILLGQVGGVADEPSLDDARQLLLTGRYAEAVPAYEHHAQAGSLPGALGLTRALAEQGKSTEAVQTLEAALDRHPQSAAIPAELARLAFEQGSYEAAQKHAAAALQLDSEQLVARWVQAELLRTAGDLQGAQKAYQWFVDHYNATDEITDPEQLRYIGLAAAQFARWNRLSDQFTFLVNDLYPEALQLDPNYWPARYEAGLLFLEKFNQAEAARELQAAVAINPNSADVQAALARLAIQNYELDAAQRAIRHAQAINPRHLGALLMRADLHLANFEPDTAVQVLETARKLNPHDEELLGRLAASYGLVDGLDDVGAASRMGQVVEQAEHRNAQAGVFYYALAEALDKARRFPHAARYFAKAVEVMPLHPGARGQLGLMQLRLGQEESARKVLAESLKIDPFNVRVSNSVKVLEVLDTYATLESEHFIIRYDKQRDALLAQYASQYLESIYPELCQRFGFEPQEKSLFEIFNHAKNTTGHGWFSARMVGLPAIHTIGACAGKVVALTSPAATERRFSWARVLKHEFVHLINLQQTDFNVPHWFTEGLAVLAEDLPRSPEWNELLVRRVAAGRTFNLDSINRAFIRPPSSEDWLLAYAQAEIYTEYMLQRFGADALSKMLTAYRDNLSTEDAISRSFGVTQQDFEQGYQAYLAEVVTALPGLKDRTPALSASALRKAQAAKPDDPDLAAQLALVYLQRKLWPRAAELVEVALAAQPQHQLAAYVKAKLLLHDGQAQAGIELLEASLDRNQPQPEVVKLLAELQLKAKKFDSAESLYLLGAKHYPADIAWTKSLAMVYLKTGDQAKLAGVLAQMAAANVDDLLIRKKLASLALESQDFAAAARWAREALEIDVLDATNHQSLAEAHLGQKNLAAAIDEYRRAVMLKPKQPTLVFGLAKALAAAGEKHQARQLLDELIKQHPDFREAQALLETLPR